MIDAMKSISDAMKKIPYEIYDLVSNPNITTDINNSLMLTITTVASAAIAIGVYAISTNLCPYILAISLVTGMAFPTFFMEKTCQVWATVYQTKNLVEPANPQDKTLPKIAFMVKNIFNRLKPIIITGTIGFFALPVTAQICTVLVGLRLGSCIGMKADLSPERVAYQPLYQA